MLPLPQPHPSLSTLSLLFLGVEILPSRDLTSQCKYIYSILYTKQSNKCLLDEYDM